MMLHEVADVIGQAAFLLIAVSLGLVALIFTEGK
jgi:hypothetical protein